jgi:spermidine synthase
MKKWTQVEQTRTPDGATLALFEHDGEYALRVNGRELMSTRKFESEKQIAVRACAPVATKTGARVLIGGLGLGFTLRAALETLGPAGEVVVAELMPEVLAWNQNPAYGLARDALADPRAKVVIADVGEVLRTSRGAFDAIILDVDNGTTAMTLEADRGLYDLTGLAVAGAALRPGGVLAYWSAGADPRFAKLLERAGFTVEVERAQAHATGGGWHTLYFGRIGGKAAASAQARAKATARKRK